MYQGSLTLHCSGIAEYRATLRQTSYWESEKLASSLTKCSLVNQELAQTEEWVNQMLERDNVLFKIYMELGSKQQLKACFK